MTKITRAQFAVLTRLNDGWVMDRSGRDSMAAVMILGRKTPSRNISAKTVSTLLREGLIEFAMDGITDYQITETGRSLLHRQGELIQ